MKITIDTHNCSREELAELKEYLEDKSWDFKADEKEEKEEPKYALRDGGICVIGSHMIALDEKIQTEELHEYSIIDRKNFIDELIGWISEARNDKEIMKDDLFMLQEWDDDYILTSNSTNSYIRQGDLNFNETCEELIELNENL
jgi:hypothetical protein